MGPIVAAVLAVSAEPGVIALSHSHQAVLPLITMILLAAMLHPRISHFLMVALCFAVSLIVLRDTWRISAVPLPKAICYDFVVTLRTCGLWTVAILTALAGIGETYKPGTVWAQRCYFGAAALYFTGVGVYGYASNASWRSLLLCIIGAAAALGCLMTRRRFGGSRDETNDLLSDEVLQQARETAHRTALQAKEWTDTLVHAMDERESSVGSSRQVTRS